MLKGLEENKLLLTFTLACEEGNWEKIHEVLPFISDRSALVSSDYFYIPLINHSRSKHFRYIRL